MNRFYRSVSLAVCAIVALAFAACGHASSHANGPSMSSDAASAARLRTFTGTQPANPSDAWLLANIAFQRLGGANAQAPPQITSVSVVGGYGIAVYAVGQSTQELLCSKQGKSWRVLGSDAYVPNGRGLVHFGLSPDLASRLIAGLKAPPTQ